MLKKLYHTLINYFSVSKSGDDIYIKIDGIPYLLSKQQDVTNPTLEKYFNKKSEWLLHNFDTNRLEGMFKYSKSLKGQFIIVFNKRGLYDLFVGNEQNGLKKLSDLEKANTHLKNTFYILERI